MNFVNTLWKKAKKFISRRKGYSAEKSYLKFQFCRKCYPVNVNSLFHITITYAKSLKSAKSIKWPKDTLPTDHKIMLNLIYCNNQLTDVYYDPLVAGVLKSGIKSGIKTTLKCHILCVNVRLA